MALSTTRWQKIILALFMLAVLWVPTIAVAQEFEDPDSALNTTTQVELNQRSAGDGTNVDLTGWRYRIYEFITGFGALFAKLGGWLLDVSISAFVLNMKGTADYLGFNSVIGSLWVVVRDLFNLLFIFGLIWIGFQTILQADESGTKRLLGSLIAAALLINFSLYISKVIIDFTNIAAYQIGQQMSLPAHDERIFGVEVLKVSSAFVAATDFDQFPAESKTAVDKLFTDQTLGTFLLGFVVMAMLIILGFVFAAGAIILFTRFVALLLLMAFSPAMFLGWVFPKFSDFGKKWWSYFFNQAIVGPAYIFMLYVALLVTQGMQGLAEYTITGLIVYFLLVVAFIWAALLVARHFGAVGATQAINIGQAAGKRVRGYAGVAAGGATFGALGYGLRQIVGQPAQRLSESGTLLDEAAKGGVRGWAARRGLGLSRTLGDTSFDARKIGGVGKRLGIGTGGKGGYKTRRDAVVKSEKEYAKSLGTVSDGDPIVKGIRESIDSTEAKIKEEKLRKEGVSNPAEKRTIQARINTLEDELKEDKERLKQEKMRRQIGSVAYNKNLIGEQTLLEDAEEELEELIKEYKESNNIDLEEDARMRKAIREKKKEVKKQRKAVKPGGYAGVLENSGFVTNIFKGRVPNESHAAGKAIRKQYESKLKQTKDDERFEGLKEEFGKSSDKDK